MGNRFLRPPPAGGGPNIHSIIEDLHFYSIYKTGGRYLPIVIGMKNLIFFQFSSEFSSDSRQWQVIDVNEINHLPL